MFANITIAPRIFVSLRAPVASGERIINVLKQFKNYCRSAVGQDRLNDFARSIPTVTVHENYISPN
jgi:hypothetical protein